MAPARNEPTVMVGKPFTFTAEEEQEITVLLRQAQRALWIRNDGYRATVVQTVTRVNRVIQKAINRGHGIDSDLPPAVTVDPSHVD
jgi:hypothetical protein